MFTSFFKMTKKTGLYFFMLLFLWVKKSNAQSDSIKNKPFTFFKVGIDVAKLGASFLQPIYKVAEIQLEANGKKTTNYIFETGWSRSNTKNDYIDFKSNTFFLRAGMDKNFFSSEYFGDKDNAFAGFRYAGAFVRNNAGVFTIKNPLWGNQSGIVDAYNFYAHWIELTGGFKVEIKRNIFLGWTIRGKTLLNGKNIKQHLPAFIAGYGNAEKQPAFDFNFYLLYGFGKR